MKIVYTMTVAHWNFFYLNVEDFVSPEHTLRVMGKFRRAWLMPVRTYELKLLK